MTRHRAEYVLPLRWQDERDLADLTGYLRWLAGRLEVTVVGKVAGVMTGLQTARHERVVIVRHFVAQRVRQAYDDFAEPGRLLRELAIVPLVIVLLARRSGLLLVAAGAAVAVAAVGRLRHGGRHAFPADTPLWAPVWLGERGVCTWLALSYRLRGGVPYAGGRLLRAATPVRTLQRRAAARRPVELDLPWPRAYRAATPETARRPT